MKLTVCGSRPNVSLWAPGREPLVHSRTEAKLAYIAGMPIERWRANVRYDNLYLTPNECSTLYPREQFHRVLDRSLEAGVQDVLFLGADAKTLLVKAQWLTWYSATDSKHRVFGVAFMPHPSGVNRWYNNPKNCEEAERFLRREMER